MKKKVIILTILTVVFVLLDQLSKLLIISNYDVDTGFKVIPSFFSIVYVRNSGAAWGMFSDGTMLLALISIVFLFFAIKYVVELKSINNFKVIQFSLLFGGIIGNLIDRLFRRYVVDFLSFKIFSYNFPVFNVADCFIVIAIILIFIEMIIDYKKSRGVRNDIK